jgi:hypothetical protein
MRCPRPVENLNRAWSLFCAQRGCEFTLATLLQNSARPAASRGEASVVIVSAHGLPACPAPQHGGPGQQSRPDDSAVPCPVQIAEPVWRRTPRRMAAGALKLQQFMLLAPQQRVSGGPHWLARIFRWSH